MAFLERSGREEPDLSGGEKSYASEGLAGGALPIGHSATRREIGPANTEGQRPTHVGMSRDDGARGLPRSLISASASTSSPTAPRPPRPALTFVTCPDVSRSLQVGPAPAKQQQRPCEPRPGSANLRPASSAAFSAGRPARTTTALVALIWRSTDWRQRSPPASVAGPSRHGFLLKASCEHGAACWRRLT